MIICHLEPHIEKSSPPAVVLCTGDENGILVDNVFVHELPNKHDAEGTKCNALHFILGI